MATKDSRVIWGSVIGIFGLALIISSPFFMFVPLIYGIPLFLIGLFIIFNRSEDKIEQIKKGRR